MHVWFESMCSCPQELGRGDEPKSASKDLDDSDLEFQKKKKEEAAALKALKEKAAGKGGFAKVKGSK